MRVLPYDLRVEPGDSSVVGPQPWLTRVHKSPTASPEQQLHRSLGRIASSRPGAQLRAIPPPLAADVVRLIVIDLLGWDDGLESHVPWRLGQHAEHRLQPRAAHVRWAEGERLQPRPGWSP
jgi:hypothetical protein